MIHAAIFHPTLTQRVEGVDVYANTGEVPNGAVVVSNWNSVGPAPFEGAEMRQSGGVLFWRETRAPGQVNVDKWKEVRSKRDAILRSSDWRPVYAADRGGPETAAWARSPWRDYRQALRDITNQADPFAIVWPVAPAA